MKKVIKINLIFALILVIFIIHAACTGKLKSAENNLNNAEAHFNSGNTYFEKGDFDHAIADWEAAMRIDPLNLDASFNLDQARRELER